MNDFILHFGAPVHCFEDQCGKLARVAFKPETRQVTDLIVEEGMILKRARVFPFTVVQKAADDNIEIDVQGKELGNFPEFRETVVEVAQEGASAEPALVQGSPYGIATSAPAIPMVKQTIIEGVDDNLGLIGKEMPVFAQDATVGKVHSLSVNPTNNLISHLLVHKGAIFVEEFWLPIGLVSRISSKGVFLDFTKDELNEMIEQDKTPEHE